MSIITNIRNGYGGRKFLRTEGRVNRTQFWTFYLYAVALSVLASTLGFGNLTLSSSSDESALAQAGAFALYLGAIAIGAFLFLTTLQVLALSVRRLHDTNHSGWWVLLPISGSLLVFATAAALFAQAVDSLTLTAENLEAGGGSGVIDLTMSGDMTIPTIAFTLAMIYSGIGSLYYLYLMLKAGDPGANRFGERP